MIIQETEIGRTDPLSTEARARAERDQQNIHITARQVDAENADTGMLNEGEQAARSDLAKAETQRLRAEAALRKQLAAKTEFQNSLQSIVTLKGELGLANQALVEYRACIATAVKNHVCARPDSPPANKRVTWAKPEASTAASAGRNEPLRGTYTRRRPGSGTIFHSASITGA